MKTDNRDIGAMVVLVITVMSEAILIGMAAFQNRHVLPSETLALCLGAVVLAGVGLAVVVLPRRKVEGAA